MESLTMEPSQQLQQETSTLQLLSPLNTNHKIEKLFAESTIAYTMENNNPTMQTPDTQLVPKNIKGAANMVQHNPPDPNLQ